MNEASFLQHAKVAVVAVSLFPVFVFAYTGRIVDEETAAPLVGAHVFAVWEGKVPNPINSVTRCYHFATTRSGAMGEFELPDRPERATGLLLVEKTHRVGVYYPGYEMSDRQRKTVPRTFAMRADKRSPSDRITRLSYGSGFTECLSKNDRGILAPMFQDRAEEALRIAVTPTDRKTALKMKGYAESLSLSREEYVKRLESGEYGR